MTARKTAHAAPTSLYAYAVESDTPPGVEPIPGLPEMVYVSTETPFGQALELINVRAYGIRSRGIHSRQARRFIWPEAPNDISMDTLTRVKAGMAPWFSYKRPAAVWKTRPIGVSLRADAAEHDRSGLLQVLREMNMARPVLCVYRPGYVGVRWSTVMVCWAEARRLHAAGCFQEMHEDF